MKVLDFVFHYLGVLEASLVKYVRSLLLNEWVSRVAHLVESPLFDDKSTIVYIQEGHCKVKYI